MVTGDLHRKFCEDRSSGFRDMLADRQTDRHTDKLMAILRSPSGGGVRNPRQTNWAVVK